MHPFATWVDSGRWGLREFGVPWSGPLDQLAFQVAQRAVGNTDWQAALELLGLGIGGTVVAPGTVAWAGAWASVQRNGRDLGPQGRAGFGAGDRIEIGPLVQGTTLCLTTPGGWTVDPVAGSVCQPLAVQEISSESNYQTSHHVHLDFAPDWLTHDMIEVPLVLTDDSRFEWPNADALSRTGEVDIQSNRMGLRLNGLGEPHAIELLSAPSAPGLVQWTPSGQWIVIGPDGPTLGGYPTLGFVPKAALPMVFQRRPGQKIRFIQAENADLATLTATADRWIRAAELSALLL